MRGASPSVSRVPRVGGAPPSRRGRALTTAARANPNDKASSSSSSSSARGPKVRAAAQAERLGGDMGERRARAVREPRMRMRPATTTTTTAGGEDGGDPALAYKKRGEKKAEAEEEAFTLGWPRTLHECYELGEEIGRGSFGVVRVARERWPVQFTSQSPSGHHMQQKFAVKSIPKRPKRRIRRKRYIQGDEEMKANAERLVRRQRAKLLGEVAFMVALADCPFSAQLVGAYEDETHAHLVVELCEGGDLKHLLQTQGPLREKHAAEIMFNALSFINHCHDKGFVFSDVKPANFMLKFTPFVSRQPGAEAPGFRTYAPLAVKGIDFGCSQRMGDPQNANVLTKRTGTPAYWAPEVFMRYYDRRADVWSCGMMMYEILVGKLPFWDDIESCTPKQVHHGVLRGEVSFAPEDAMADCAVYDSLEEEEDDPALPAAVPVVSPAAQDLIRRMLDKDPKTRITVQEALDHPWITENHCL